MRVKPEAIAALLTTAHVAHQQYRAAQPQIRAGRMIPGDAARAQVALQQALDARTAAHEADPAHTAPAWTDEEPQHDVLVAFYQTELAKRN